MTWVFFLSLWPYMVSSWFMETPGKGKTCTTFTSSFWPLIEVRTLGSSRHSWWLYWVMLLVTISILVNCALISKFSTVIRNGPSLVFISSSLTFLKSSAILSHLLERSVTDFSSFSVFPLLLALSNDSSWDNFLADFYWGLGLLW